MSSNLPTHVLDHFASDIFVMMQNDNLDFDDAFNAAWTNNPDRLSEHNRTESRNRVIVLYLQRTNESYREIGRRVSLSHTMIYNINIGNHNPNPDLTYPIREYNPDTRNISNTTLTENDVITIRELLDNGVPIRVIAEEYGVTTHNIYAIRDNRSWQHVK